MASPNQIRMTVVPTELFDHSDQCILIITSKTKKTTILLQIINFIYAHQKFFSFFDKSFQFENISITNIKLRIL